LKRQVFFHVVSLFSRGKDVGKPCYFPQQKAISFQRFGGSPRYLYFSFVCSKEKKVAKEKGTPPAAPTTYKAHTFAWWRAFLDIF
jgi:hypothetical protein